jgi:hypothetical protein
MLLQQCDVCKKLCSAEHVIQDMDEKRKICIYCFVKEKPEQLKKLPKEFQKEIKENPDG